MIFYKNLFKTIKHTIPRFISILCICMLGASVLTGILATSKDMKLTMYEYFKNTNLFDYTLISNYGFDSQVQKLFEDYQPTFFTTYEHVGEHKEKSYTFKIVSSENNNYQLINGRLPKEHDEVLIMKKTKNHEIQLNDEIQLTTISSIKKSILKQQKFKVVGEVNSSEFISNLIGNTSIQNGKIDYVIFLNKANFTNEYPTHVHLRVPKLKQYNPFEHQYKSAAADEKIKLEKIIEIQQNAMQTRLIQTIEENFNEKIREILQQEEVALQKINTEQINVTQHLQQLNLQQKQLKNPVNKQQIIALQTVEKSIQQLKAVQFKLNEQQNKLKIKFQEAKDEINTQKIKQQDLKVKWYITTRNENNGFYQFEDQANNISSLAKIFPAIFFFVAVLITMIAMSRMIIEEQKLIGTFMFLGYSKFKIRSRYLIYGFIPALLGSTIGVFIGMYFIPFLLLRTYRLLFIFPKHIYHFDITIAIFSICVVVMFALITILFVTNKILSQHPAQLLVGKNEKPGKKILLEKIKPIWKHLKFLQKITLRNTFLSKVRLIMTVIGVAGCVLLLLCGLGLSNSVKTVATLQFQTIQKYDGEMQIPNNINIDVGLSVFKEILQKDNDYIILINTDERINDYIQMTKPFKNNQTIITQKIAEAHNLKVGDIFTIESFDKSHIYHLKIDGITKNYIYNYIYVGKEVLQKENNTGFLKKHETNTILNHNQSYLKTILLNDTIKKEITSMIDSIELVIAVMVVFSLLLMFIVVFNLTSININERQKELATLKVLGFYPKEVKKYIFKEIVLLTILGIFSGLILGSVVFTQLLKTVESANIAFENQLPIHVYIQTTLIAFFMMWIVNFIMQRPISKINMLEALKSHE